MAKAKFDAKDFLLRKGEKLAMVASGFFLVVLLIWGATKWSSAKDPTTTANKLKQQSQQVQNSIQTGTPSETDLNELKMPAWLVQPPDFKTAKVPAFSQTGQLFDPTAQPSTKRENPIVLPIRDYQVDLTRSAMIGYDIIINNAGEAEIAVLIDKKEGALDKDKIKGAAATLNSMAAKGALAKAKLAQAAAKTPMAGGGVPPAAGGGGIGIPGVGPGMSGPGGSEEGNPYGSMAGGSFNQNAQRGNEKAIKYIPLAEIEKEGKPLALTVIPLRLVTVHAVVPYKKQLEELKRALRLTNEAEAKQWGPWYDGFEVQRRVTRILPNGTVQVIQEWPEKPSDPKDTSGNYKFEEKYIDVIDRVSVAGHFDEGYIPYFTKPEMMLTMPLPKLAEDLKVKYPEIKLKDINDNIDKLKKANQKAITQSELVKQVTASKVKNDLYKPKTADALNGLGYNAQQFGTTSDLNDAATGVSPMPKGPVSPMPVGGSGGKPGSPTPLTPDGYGNTTASVATEVENFLLRFVDCDVKPGYTYEYRIRLLMWNPNYKQDAHVANPEYAKESYKTLYSPWRQLEMAITVPAESFLYAHDVKSYREQINTTYPLDSKEPETKAINNLLQVKENQAVLQVATWMEQVRTDGNKREPVGAWVVAEMPVGRGEFVGRKQFVKLPLWSSEAQPKPRYLLREVADKVVKGKHQPKGWLVDFSTKSVLVDFEGGKVKSRTKMRFDDRGLVVPGDRTFDEDAATEVLIVRADGKLVVRSSQVDDTDPNRKAITSEWTRWVQEVEKLKGPATGGDPNLFDPKP